MAGWQQAGVSQARDVIVGRDIKIPQFAAACCGQAVVAGAGPWPWQRRAQGEEAARGRAQQAQGQLDSVS